MDYLSRLHQLCQPYTEALNLQLQLTEVDRCVAEIQAGQLLSRPFPLLGLNDDDWLTFLEIASAQPHLQLRVNSDYRVIDQLLHNFRKFLQYHFGQWTLISQQAVAMWTKFWPFRRYLELMAGNGLLAKALQGRGQSVIATDSFAWQGENQTGRQLFFPVQNYSATAAITKFGEQVDTIILSWSPDRDPLDWCLLQRIRQLPNHPDLLVIGEKFGVTNSELFWRTQPTNFSAQIQLTNRYLPRRDLVAEQLFLFR